MSVTTRLAPIARVPHGQLTMSSYFKRKSSIAVESVSNISKKRPVASPNTRTNAGESKQGFVYSEKKGDLFQCPQTDSMAHCISEDAKMGKGVAVHFKRKFGGVQEIISQRKKPGDAAVLKRGGRFIFYLVTKEKYWHKPTYDTVRNSLKAMLKYCQDYKVKAISMPKIGCGLDRLEWTRVVELIHKIFQGSGITITVYKL